MATRHLQVTVDQWGHAPAIMKGQIVSINDDEPDNVLYSIDGSEPAPFAADVAFAIASGSVLEVDEDGVPIDAPRRRPSPFGAQTAVAPDEADVAEAEVPDPDVPEDELTPAQKAARTRAANRARESEPAS